MATELKVDVTEDDDDDEDDETAQNKTAHHGGERCENWKTSAASCLREMSE